MDIFCPGFFGLLGSLVGLVATQMTETSISVRLAVDVVNIIKFEHKVGNCGKVGCGARHE